MKTPSGKSADPPNIVIDSSAQAESRQGLAEEDRLDAVFEKAPPWLFSVVVHVLLLIALALIALNLPIGDPHEIVLQPVRRDESDLRFEEVLGDPEKTVTPIQSSDPVEQVENPVLTDERSETSKNPEEVRPEIEHPESPGRTEDDPQRNPIVTIMNVPTRLDAEARRTAMTDGGGDETTEASVIRGLQWLARHQFSDGHWSLRGSRYRGGSYGDGIRSVDNTVAATGLALLAFQGHGNTLQRGEFSTNVKQAWKWLIARQHSDGCFYDYDIDIKDHRFYTHGICTIAVCELYAMTPDNHPLHEEFRLAAQSAVDYCVRTQSKTGGWRYDLDGAGISDDSDLSVTGWILMALQSARMAGLVVPEATLERVSTFLDEIALEGGSRYPYRNAGNPKATRSMTAEGLLCREFLGWKREDQRLEQGLRWLIQPENLVNYEKIDQAGRRGNLRDVYYWYYATQALHHFGGPQWKTWNDAMKREVCSHQFVRDGHKDSGSWDPHNPIRDEYAGEGGRLYVTCLSIYMLEVYYRHLPIYKTIVPE